MGLLDKIKDIFLTPTDDYEEGMDNAEQAQTESEDYTTPSYTTAAKTQSVGNFNLHGNADLKVVLVKPERYSEQQSIADHLRDRCTVVLNMENTSHEICERLLDFLAGAAYVTGGTLQPVASKTYIITPKGVDVMGDATQALDDTEVSLF